MASMAAASATESKLLKRDTMLNDLEDLDPGTLNKVNDFVDDDLLYHRALIVPFAALVTEPRPAQSEQLPRDDAKGVDLGRELVVIAKRLRRAIGEGPAASFCPRRALALFGRERVHVYRGWCSVWLQMYVYVHVYVHVVYTTKKRPQPTIRKKALRSPLLGGEEDSDTSEFPHRSHGPKISTGLDNTSLSGSTGKKHKSKLRSPLLGEEEDDYDHAEPGQDFGDEDFGEEWNDDERDDDASASTSNMEERECQKGSQSLNRWPVWIQI